MNQNNNEEGERIIDKTENLALSIPAQLTDNSSSLCEMIAVDFTETVDLQLLPYKKRLIHKLANRKSRLK
ncbi:hypothetical protein [Enterobacter sp. Bisph1]|uniref:hypothetical protein n=1 Tax=Enterobacter sp. Bisph1 TaxID=1274399 RepID=UPI00057BE366|nr:hypothetical protein [Enterobacter sp. Bisph1]